MQDMTLTRAREGDGHTFTCLRGRFLSAIAHWNLAEQTTAGAVVIAYSKVIAFKGVIRVTGPFTLAGRFVIVRAVALILGATLGIPIFVAIPINITVIAVVGLTPNTMGENFRGIGFDIGELRRSKNLLGQTTDSVFCGGNGDHVTGEGCEESKLHGDGGVD